MRGGTTARVFAACAVIAALVAPVRAGAILDGNAPEAPVPDLPVAPPATEAPTLDPQAGPVRAGAAVVDATWHVGASAGQYAHKYYDSGLHGRGIDPHLQSTTAWPSYGLESRSDVRALVLEDHEGERVALVSNDLYIPQDLVNRRVATILEERDTRIRLGLEPGHLTGIDERNMSVSVSHSHSSVYLSTPSWGVWAFEDVFDVRFFEYVAQAMAEAVVQATDPEVMRRVRMGAAEIPYAATHRHSYGPQIADDGTPAGYPETDNDSKITVVRFDEITDGGEVVGPLATWVTYGLHPEMLDGNDILSGEYVNAMYRLVDAATDGVTLFSQRNIGTAEPARDARAHAPSDRAEFSHKEYAQMTRAARLVADAVLEAWEGVDDGVAPDGGKLVPPRDEFEVAMADLRFAPPSARFLPVVSSCRMEQLFKGNPPVPIAGLPDCAYPTEGFWPGGVFDPSVTYETLREAGVPVPDNVPGPSYTGLQETIQVHLQAIRLGDIGITVCPCEQFADQSRNIESRLDDDPDTFWIGFRWWKQDLPPTNPRADAGNPHDFCTQNGDTTWTCADPRNPSVDRPPVSDLAYRRMVAQVENDAAGWDEAANSLRAESEPVDPADVWGNFTHEQLTDHAYDMVIPVGMANDYWGYIVSYREFQAHDHYRKALTGLGPHSMDFFATRLSRMAASLNGGPGVSLGAKDLAYAVENEHQRNRARAIGELASQYLPAYAATLPSDASDARIVDQPAGTERFGATTIEWVGGSNWFDLPEVKVQRRASGGTWVDFGDTTGHVQLKVTYPDGPEQLATWRAGDFEWHWQANFEAFVSDIELADARGGTFQATPAGDYRFVIRGVQHEGAGATSPYTLVSDEFAVEAWDGIQASVEADAAADLVTVTVSGVDNPDSGVGPIDYPDTYADPIFDEFINGTRERKYGPSQQEEFCFQCSFRPWLDAGDAASVMVSVNGGPAQAATRVAPGVWELAAPLAPGDAVAVAAGAVNDGFGNVNGSAATAAAV